MNSEYYFTKSAKRPYKYSSADQVVDAADIDAHIRHARVKGCDVSMLSLDDSSRVPNLKCKHSEQYWTSVKTELELEYQALTATSEKACA